jgi:RimJ/RimL family protein N-acetyltransferase
MSVTIRQARLEDAEQLLAHIQAIAAEPEVQILLESDEVLLTLKEERQWLKNHLASRNSTLLVAEAGGRIVGVLSCEGGQRNAVRHVVKLGVSVRKEWRDQGIGRALMERAIAWAKEIDIVKRIELHVTVRNPRAVHLYEKLGFEKEGKMRRGFFKNGQYLDLWLMARLLE